MQNEGAFLMLNSHITREGVNVTDILRNLHKKFANILLDNVAGL